MLISTGLCFGGLFELKEYFPAVSLTSCLFMGGILVSTLWYWDANSKLIAPLVLAYTAWAIGHGRREHRAFVNARYEHYKVAELTIKLQTQINIAQTATEAKTRFLAAASHDLRQPMHALNLYLGTMSHFALPSESVPVLAKVRECAHIMDEMFAALLDISRLDADVLKPISVSSR